MTITNGVPEHKGVVDVATKIVKAEGVTGRIKLQRAPKVRALAAAARAWVETCSSLNIVH